MIEISMGLSDLVTNDSHSAYLKRIGEDTREFHLDSFKKFCARMVRCGTVSFTGETYVDRMRKGEMITFELKEKIWK